MQVQLMRDVVRSILQVGIKGIANNDAYLSALNLCLILPPKKVTEVSDGICIRV